MLNARYRNTKNGVNIKIFILISQEKTLAEIDISGLLQEEFIFLNEHNLFFDAYM